MTSLSASSTVMPRAWVSPSGTRVRNPVVGLGLVTTKTLSPGPVGNPTVSPVTKPTVYIPARGHWISTGRRNAARRCRKIESLIDFVAE